MHQNIYMEITIDTQPWKDGIQKGRWYLWLYTILDLLSIELNSKDFFFRTSRSEDLCKIHIHEYKLIHFCAWSTSRSSTLKERHNQRPPRLEQMKPLKLLSRLVPHLSAFFISDNYPLPSTLTAITRAGTKKSEKNISNMIWGSEVERAAL